MNKRELTEQLAKQGHKSRAKAAEEVDSLVYALLKDLKQTSKTAEDKTAITPPKAPSITPEPKAPSKGKK